MKKDVNGFIDTLKSIISDIPYSVHKEKISEGYFHTVFHAIMSVIGLRPISEKETANGRIDERIELPSCIYIMEFKYSEDGKDLSDIALRQIENKEYHQPDHLSGKEIIGIGLSYSQETRNINGKCNKTLFNLIL